MHKEGSLLLSDYASEIAATDVLSQPISILSFKGFMGKSVE